MRNDFKMSVFKQLTISITTQNDNKIKVSCSVNQQSVTLHVKHDRRNFKSFNIIWCVVCSVCIYWDAWFFFLKKNFLRSPCWMQTLWDFFTFYTIFTSYIATLRPTVTLSNYQPVAWVLYQRVIDQSKADIFIKPGINVFVGSLFSSSCQRQSELLPSLGVSRPSSVVHRLSSVNFPHFKLLLWNPLAKWTDTW